MRPPAISGCAQTCPSSARAKRRFSFGWAGAPWAMPARELAPPNVVHDAAADARAGADTAGVADVAVVADVSVVAALVVAVAEALFVPDPDAPPQATSSSARI